MRYVCMLLVITAFTSIDSTVNAQTQQISISAPFNQMDQTLSANITANISQPTAQINNGGQGAEAILRALPIEIGGVTSTDPAFNLRAFENKDFYCIFHILRWSNPSGGKQTVQAQKWYLYNQGKLQPATPTDIPRLFGIGTITFLFIHLNKDAGNDYRPLYDFEIKKRTPAYVSHLLGLTGLFGVDSNRFNLAGATLEYNWWGLATLQLNYKVADITAIAKLTRPTAVEVISDAQKFDNEGKYLMDFSVGVPVRRISELKFDSLNNTVSVQKVERTNILAFVNVYPRPIDIRSNNVDFVPHFVGGVAIDKQPLHKIFVGTGFGPLVANFYIGALFVKQDQLQSLQPGDASTPTQLTNDIRRKYKTQIAFGVNMPVGAIIEKLKGK